ncbi:hypothetical protein [Vibrio alfacsensis]|uniref:hypothetical protein n=1 Tax=Vibrio alfacsensis TaxID=1074311 RepID=UPI0040676FA1
MTKINYFLSARKFLVVAGLFLIVNGAIFYAAEASKVKLIGKIEGLGHSWLAFASYDFDQLTTKFYYSKLSKFKEEQIALHHEYSDLELRKGGYIAFGVNETDKIHYMRVFSLDDQCMLFFSGQSELLLNNVSMRCFY